jgi:hypothetical protein
LKHDWEGVLEREWQQQRNALNHHWLKNEFTRHLRAFVARSESSNGDLQRMREFLREDWEKWRSNRERIATLLETAEAELSPRRLFLIPPLSRCSERTMRWLPDVVHSLWLERSRILERVSAARTAFSAANERYCVLDATIADKALDVATVKTLTDEMRLFEKDVQHLSACLSRFPSRNPVV